MRMWTSQISLVSCMQHFRVPIRYVAYKYWSWRQDIPLIPFSDLHDRCTHAAHATFDGTTPVDWDIRHGVPAYSSQCLSCGTPGESADRVGALRTSVRRSYQQERGYRKHGEIINAYETFEILKMNVNGSLRLLL